jgi:hypothetical protein
VAAVPRKTSPLVWVLVGILGLFVLGIVAVISAGFFVAKNPGLVIGKLITAANPNAEVLSTDLGAKTVRIRDRQTGKEVTVSFDDVKSGKIKFSAVGDDGEVATMEMGGGGKVPSWVPTYPGATAQGNMTARGGDADGMGEGGVVTYSTSDSPAQVLAFYRDKMKDMGMKLDMNETSGQGGMLTAADEANHRALHVIVGSGSNDGTSIVVTFGRKR